MIYDKEGNSLLCSRSDAMALVAEAEKEKGTILGELKGYVKGDIDIRILPKQHVFGWGVWGELLVNGEIVREYPMIELLFLDLNELMLKLLLEQRSKEAKHHDMHNELFD